MGKKAYLKIDLTFDPYTDEYNDGDEEDFDDYESGQENSGHAPAAMIRSAAGASEYAPSTHTDSDNKVAPAARESCDMHIAKGKPNCNPHPRQSKPTALTVVTPKAAKKNAQIRLHYVPNPKRLPLFTDHVASHDGLLVHVAAYLDLEDVLTLGMVSKLLQNALSADGLYCNNRGEGCGILLPCLRHLSESLLPVPDTQQGRRRPRRVSQNFAYECRAFSKSGQLFGAKRTIRPRTIMNINTSEEIAAMSFRRVRWGQSNDTPRRGQSAPRGTGIRLAYVRTDANNAALVTVWGGENLNSSGAEAMQQSTVKERYLPHDTKTILGAAFHSDMCALLTDLSSAAGYILSMVALPALVSSKCSLKWRKGLPSNWRLFSSSATHPVVSFSTQGTYLIVGSTERFGVYSTDGEQLWSIPDNPIGSSPYSTLPSSRQQVLGTTGASSLVSASLIHHEFCFLLDDNGSRLRVYDVSNHACHVPLAEGRIPWSLVISQRQKQAQGPTRLHHTYEQHRQHLRDEYQLSFCAGKVWVTGMYYSDLLCSSPPRLLRRLRSRLPSANGSNSILTLIFTSAKSDLNLGTPHTMHAVNDTHLYVSDPAKLQNRQSKVHCWRSNSTNAAGTGGQISTVLSVKSYIERIYADATKIVVGTNTTYRNTDTRSWSGSGGIWVVPVDHAKQVGEPITEQSLHCQPELQPFNQTPPSIQLYHKRLFSVQSFASDFDQIGRHPRYPISSSSNSNYKIIDLNCDGRYVLAYCNKGNSTKSVILDLYDHEE